MGIGSASKRKDIADEAPPIILVPEIPEKKLKEEPEWKKILREKKEAKKTAPRKIREKKEVAPIDIKANPQTGAEQKKYASVTINGNTPELIDFRAICKKRQKTIGEVLTLIISKWNAENYNL